MSSSIRSMVRRTIESPAGGLVVTALAWAVAWPWLSHGQRRTAAAA
ncbi:MAG TPA: hypothetical protein VJB61_11255 [Actinomycetota bacterium]